MVCGGMFGVWSRVDGVGNKIYIIKKDYGYNMLVSDRICAAFIKKRHPETGMPFQRAVNTQKPKEPA